MLHMLGVKPAQYWIGLFLGDWTLQVMPSAVLSIGFLFASTVMASKAIIPFFFTYLAFGGAFIPVIYLMTHIFDEIETAGKWVGMLTLLFLLIVPIGLACIIALMLHGDYANNLLDIVGVFIFIDPVACFVIACWNLSCSYKIDEIQGLKLALLGREEPFDAWVSIVLLIIQAIIFVSANILLDKWLQ